MKYTAGVESEAYQVCKTMNIFSMIHVTFGGNDNYDIEVQGRRYLMLPYEWYVLGTLQTLCTIHLLYNQ